MWHKPYLGAPEQAGALSPLGSVRGGEWGHASWPKQNKGGPNWITLDHNWREGGVTEPAGPNPFAARCTVTFLVSPKIGELASSSGPSSTKTWRTACIKCTPTQLQSASMGLSHIQGREVVHYRQSSACTLLP